MSTEPGATILRRRLRGAAAAVAALVLALAVVPTPPASAEARVRFKEIAVGPRQAYAITTKGVLYGWGRGGIGDGTTKRRTLPTRVRIPSGVKVKAVSAGGDVNAALSTKGHIYTWGSNWNGALGVGTKKVRESLVPVKVKRPKGHKFVAVAAGGSQVLALTDKGAVYAWGDNAYGQLGDGTTRTRFTPVKVKMPKGVKVKAIGATQYFASFAIAADGTAYSWGLNLDGELGNGEIEDLALLSWGGTKKPKKMVPPDGVQYRKLARNSFLALGSDGRAYSWGSNVAGTLGNGTIDRPCTKGCLPKVHLDPVAVSVPKGVRFTSVDSSAANRYAIGSDGRVYAWGSGRLGMIGDGAVKTRKKPVPVKLPTKRTFVRVAAADKFVLALADDGTLYSWGSRAIGTLGEGKVKAGKYRKVPAKVLPPRR